MLPILYFKVLGIYFILSEFIYSTQGVATVKMTVTVNLNSMTLSCIVTDRDSRKNIYLFCPLEGDQFNCRENCVKQCQNENCLVESLIQCYDQGFNSNSGLYQIDYVIDGSRSENHGKWHCQYGGISSSVIYVNASSSKPVLPQKFIPVTTHPPETKESPNLEFGKLSKGSPQLPNSPKKPPTTSSDDLGFQYDKLLTKSEFIISVIGLLALSLLINVFFCCRMVIVHCRSKKKSNDGSQYFTMNPHHPHYNRSNSQVSDPDRIYEDTSINQRQMSFLTQIKNANGNYLAPSTLSPTSGMSTIIPHLSFNQPITFAQSPSDSGNTILTNHPFIATDPSMQANYASVTFPTENNYTNFLSEMCTRDVNVSQPVYLAFQSTHPMMTAGNRYVQYSSQPLQSAASISSNKDTNRLTSPRTECSSTSTMAIGASPPQSSNRSNGPVSTEDGKSNYQLSREMMEEADTLLRTADNLLKTTEHEMKYYQQ